jgi:hypothetical protein
VNTNPNLWRSGPVVKEFMGLLWEDRQWKEAERRAKDLANRSVDNARDWSVVWQGLTNAARYLDERDQGEFERWLDIVKEACEERDAEFLELYEEQRRKLIDRTIEKLLKEGRERANRGEPEDIVAAASNYALAHRLDPDNRNINRALDRIHADLQFKAQEYVEQAGQFTLTIPLKDSLLEAKRLMADLNDMTDLAPLVALDRTLIDDLRRAGDELSARVKDWEDILNQLKLVDLKRDQARSRPAPFQSQSGGWDIQPASRQLSKVQTEVQNKLPADVDINNELNRRRRDLHRLDSKATELNSQTLALLNAVDEERFDDVGAAAHELKQTWSDAQAEFGFAGLEYILMREDRFSNPTKVIDTIDGHTVRSQSQKVNHGQWQKWADDIIKRYGEVEQSARFLKESLDSRRQSVPLADIREECKTVLARCEQFVNESFRLPAIKPLSRSAEKEK